MISENTKKIIGYLTMLDYNTEDRSENGNAYFRKNNINGILSRGGDLQEIEQTLNLLIKNGVLINIHNLNIDNDQYTVELIDLKKARKMLTSRL